MAAEPGILEKKLPEEGVPQAIIGNSKKLLADFSTFFILCARTATAIAAYMINFITARKLFEQGFVLK